MAQLKMMATSLKSFGINPAKPELTLILLANIHHAKEQEWRQEFCATMSAIWKKYSYDHVHDATSMAYILKELAGADKLRAMKLAPAPNLSKANAVGKYPSILRVQMTAGARQSQATQIRQVMIAKRTGLTACRMSA